jgi:hypothetical protein
MNEITSGASELSDDQFVAAMEGLAVPKEAFRHRDHIRLAWLYLQRSNAEEAGERFSVTVRRFAVHHGVPEKYHHTITLAWMRLIAASAILTPHLDFNEFVAAHPFLLDVKLPWAFYSSERLASAEARTGWSAPDLHPVP